MKNLGQIMKQVQDMQERMSEMQAKLAETEVTGTSGAGMVQATLNGKGELKRIKIDPSLLKPEEAEVVEDLIVAAVNDAKSKVDERMQSEMGKLTGGLPLPPGFKLPF
jgi:DNA-binding YbaB/EbfC family protein